MGDVDYEAVSTVASAITPVPGGVGSVTTTMMLELFMRRTMHEMSIAEGILDIALETMKNMMRLSFTLCNSIWD